MSECMHGLSGCNQNCSNTYGSYQCFCDIEYYLHENGKACLGI